APCCTSIMSWSRWPIAGPVHAAPPCSSVPPCDRAGDRGADLLRQAAREVLALLPARGFPSVTILSRQRERRRTCRAGSRDFVHHHGFMKRVPSINRLSGLIPDVRCASLAAHGQDRSRTRRNRSRRRLRTFPRRAGTTGREDGGWRAEPGRIPRLVRTRHRPVPPLPAVAATGRTARAAAARPRSPRRRRTV